MRYHLFVFTDNDPRKGWRIPLNEIKYNEQRDEETNIGYCDTYQPHAPRRIKDTENQRLYDLQWDRAGNLGQCNTAKDDGSWLGSRHLFWTADCCGPRPCGANRMHTAVDDKYYSYYTYDHSGGSCASREQSQACLSYAETKQSVRSNRVAARLGGGGLDALYHAIGNNNTIQTKANLLFDQSLEQVNNRILYENDLDCIMQNEFSKEEFGKWIEGIPYHVRADVETEYWQFKDMIHSMLEDLHDGKESAVYFYHSDLCGSRAQSQTCLSYAEMKQSVRSKHLGSASWITDFGGVAVQHIQYLPYGEPYINQRPFGYSERFTFTGKEKDEETN